MVNSNNSSQVSRLYWLRGEPWVWLCGGGLAVILVMVFTMFWVVGSNGFSAFWLKPIFKVKLADDSYLLGEIVKEEDVGTLMHKIQYKVGNREIYGLDFRWVDAADVVEWQTPEDVVMLERQEYGNFYGWISGFELSDFPMKEGPLPSQLKEFFRVSQQRLVEIESLKDEIGDLNHELEEVRLQALEDGVSDWKLLPEAVVLQKEFERVLESLNTAEHSLSLNKVILRDVSGKVEKLSGGHLVRFVFPNQAGIGAKLLFYAEKVWELLSGDPRESNTEGGLFPAIFGTVFMIFLMSLFSFPMGVIAGIYLREYAKEGVLVRTVRIAVNNLAGIPAIVYGIFGLGFFIYGIGAFIDQSAYSERLPEPTFGTGGVLWASLTLGILTIPVVIVATEEALGAIPRAIRESSLALGATKFQTLVKILLPSASPGIITGLILSMARAAGEVAPLMITGVVKLAPTLPIDGNWPFLHLERKFMHLGFHIYDISCQSPNVEAAKPMVYVTTVLLLIIVLVLSSFAIWLRARMKRKFQVAAV